MNSPTWILRLARELPPGPSTLDVICITPKRYTRAVAKAAVAAPRPESGSCTSKFIHASTNTVARRRDHLSLGSRLPGFKRRLPPNSPPRTEMFCCRIGHIVWRTVASLLASAKDLRCAASAKTTQFLKRVVVSRVRVRQPWRRADQGDKLRPSKCGCPSAGSKKTRAAKRLDAARARYVRRLSVRPRLHRNP